MSQVGLLPVTELAAACRRCSETSIFVLFELPKFFAVLLYNPATQQVYTYLGYNLLNKSESGLPTSLDQVHCQSMVDPNGMIMIRPSLHGLQAHRRVVVLLQLIRQDYQFLLQLIWQDYQQQNCAASCKTAAIMHACTAASRPLQVHWEGGCATYHISR